MQDEVTVHLFPVQVCIYADGYTVAGGAACDHPGLSDFRRDLPLNTMMQPLAVTCRTCEAHPMFRKALNALEHGAPPPYPLNVVDRMAHQVYRRGGRYNIEENNLVRQWLGFDPISPEGHLIEAIFAAEVRIHQEHRASRHRSEEIDRYMAEQGIIGTVCKFRGNPPPDSEMISPPDSEN